MYDVLLYQIPDSSSDESEDSRARIGPPRISPSSSSPPESDPEENPDVPMDAEEGEVFPEIPAPEIEIPPFMLPDFQQLLDAVQVPPMVVPLRMQPTSGRVPSETSVTSRPQTGEPRTIIYRVYAELGRECDYL